MGELETWKLEVGKNFQDYKSLVSVWGRDQLSQPGSNYSNLKTDVEDFNSQLNEALKTIREQYWDRNLGTCEKVPTSLMDYLITLSATSSGKRR